MKTFIIDDDNISIFLTQHVLRESGYKGEIATFLSAEEALRNLLQNIAEEVPDIILLDLNMPGMDGWEFLEALAPYKEVLSGKCQIHILTSSLDLSDMVKAKTFDLVFGFIFKTITPADVQLILSLSKSRNAVC